MSEWIAKSIEHLLDFSNILNASIAASWMVLAVIVLRFLLKKAPRWIHVALWGLVAVRLLLPFSIESSLSLIPSAETISHEILQVEGTQLQEPAYLDVVSNPIFPNGASVEIGQTIDRVQVHMTVMTLIWLIGVAVLLVYTITSYWHLRRKVREAVILRDNIFQSENAGSPFILGIIKPRMYLPYKIEEQTLVHVIAHEQAHIQRKDHWWKPLGFLLLTIHWFNPLMWLGYVLLCRDIELACDEKVIKNIDSEQRANYSQALVACSVKRPMIAACPLAFGEVGVKERVKSVLNYKKPAFWIIAVAVVACIVVGVCFLTSPKAGKDTITYVHQDTSIGQRADFNVDIGKNVTRAELVAEMWQNGQCTSSSPVIITSQTEKITLLFSDRQENLNLIGENIQIDTDETAGSLVTYFAFPERVVGWAFTSWQDAVNVPVKAGEDVILAAMACDMGSGVRSIDCQSLTLEPERLSSADCMIVVRAKFYGSVVSSDKVTLSEMLSPDYRHDGVWTYLSEDYSVSSSFVVNDDMSITGVVSKDGVTTDFSIVYRMVKGNDNRAVCKFYNCAPEIANQAEGETHFMFEARMKAKNGKIQFEFFDENGAACFGKKKVQFALAVSENTQDASKWFDALHGDEMVWDGRQEINLDEFPGVTFRVYSEKIEAVTDKEIIPLYTGMPIWSVYFCDLNGDEKPEICSSISLGSGIIDNRIIVADYANKGVYELSDRGYFDYVLTCQDGQLWAEKRAYMQDEVLEAAPLMLRSVVGTDGAATPMLMFGQSELNNRDADTPNSAERLYTYNVAYANWTEDSSIYMRSLNSNRMTDNAYLHLPIYKFDTKSDLDSFKTHFGDILAMDQSYDEVPSFEYITAAYDDSFFSKYSLMLAYIQANSGSYRFGVSDVYCDSQSFCMYIEQLNDPETHTDDMAGWFAVVEVDKEDIANCTSFDAQIGK